MSTPTPFLSALVVLSSAFPTQVLPVGSVPARVRLLFVAGAATVMAGLAWYVAPATGVLRLPAIAWYGDGILFGLGAPGIEVGLGALWARLRGSRVARIALHQQASVTALGVIAAVVTAIAEEVLFRGVGLHLLETVLHWPALAAVAMSALVYGLNHLWFGGLTVAQKVVSGLGFGALYDLSGHSLLVPLLAHVVQNLLVLLVLPRLVKP